MALHLPEPGLFGYCPDREEVFMNDDLYASSRIRRCHLLGFMQYEDGLQPGEKNLVLSRVRKSGTRTSRTAIPERIHTKVLDNRA